jgi:hypothetical protein
VAIALSVLLILIGVVSYGLWSKQTWDAYQPTYTQRHQAIIADVTAITTAKATTDKERRDVLTSLKKLTEKIQTTDQTVCHTHPLIAWQVKISNELNAAQSSCAAMVSKVTRLEAPLKKVTTYTKNDNELAAILATVPQSSELADDAWDKQVSIWQDAGKAMEKLSVSSEFTPVKQLATAKTLSVRDAWQAVIAAHQAKDKSKYLAAQGDLARALDALNEITVLSEKELQPLRTELEKATSVAVAS